MIARLRDINRTLKAGGRVRFVVRSGFVVLISKSGKTVNAIDGRSYDAFIRQTHKGGYTLAKTGRVPVYSWQEDTRVFEWRLK
jgi:hypothetical protein